VSAGQNKAMCLKFHGNYLTTPSGRSVYLSLTSIFGDETLKIKQTAILRRESSLAWANPTNGLTKTNFIKLIETPPPHVPQVFFELAFECVNALG